MLDIKELVAVHGLGSSSAGWMHKKKQGYIFGRFHSILNSKKTGGDFSGWDEHTFTTGASSESFKFCLPSVYIIQGHQKSGEGPTHT